MAGIAGTLEADGVVPLVILVGAVWVARPGGAVLGSEIGELGKFMRQNSPKSIILKKIFDKTRINSVGKTFEGLKSNTTNTRANQKHIGEKKKAKTKKRTKYKFHRMQKAHNADFVTKTLASVIVAVVNVYGVSTVEGGCILVLMSNKAQASRFCSTAYHHSSVLYHGFNVEQNPTVALIKTNIQ